MENVNRVIKTAELSKLDIVKYQIITYCYFEKISISDAAALCLAYLCINGKTELSKFCNQMAEEKVFASSQVVRNTINLSEEKKLVIKEGDKIMISLNPELKIQFTGTILLDFKFLHRAFG